MMNDGKRLYDRNLTDEQLEEIKYDYDFSKVNLRNFSKKQLIRIIYDLKRQVDMYKAGVSDESYS